MNAFNGFDTESAFGIGTAQKLASQNQRTRVSAG